MYVSIGSNFDENFKPDKMAQILTKFWRNFDEILTKFWRNFDEILTKFWRNFDEILTKFRNFDEILTKFRNLNEICSNSDEKLKQDEMAQICDP
jgi:hypothetical protein